MKLDLPVIPSSDQSARPQLAAAKGPKPRRKRITAIHRGALAGLDAAIEARCDSEAASDEYDVRRPDAQDLFAWQTRKLVRRAEGLLRSINQKIADMDAELRGNRSARRVA